MLPAQLLSRFSRQLFPSSKSTATFHLLIQRLRFVLFLPKIRVSLSVSSSVNTFSYFPLFFPSLVLSALVFSGKSWWKVQASTLTLARELAVTDFSFESFVFFFSFSCINLHEYITYIDNRKLRSSVQGLSEWPQVHHHHLHFHRSGKILFIYLLVFEVDILFKFDYRKVLFLFYDIRYFSISSFIGFCIFSLKPCLAAHLECST